MAIPFNARNGLTVGNVTTPVIDASGNITANSITLNVGFIPVNVGTSTTGALPYQNSTNQSTFLPLGTTNFVLTAGASSPQWVAQSSLAVGNASLATATINISGGLTGSIPYQIAANTTAFLPVAPANYLLSVNNSNAPVWIAPSTAITNLLPAGGLSGQVLATGGVGSYFWTNNGGTATSIGTAINSTRIDYVVGVGGVTIGQTLFTTPTYIVGASQLRVYINGVRQYPTDYTETSTTSVTLNVGVGAADQIMVEVDGYVQYNPTAVGVTCTAPGAILTGTNVQTVLNQANSLLAPLASPTFTGTITGVNATLSGTLSVTGLSTLTGGVTGGAASFTTGTFSGAIGGTSINVTGLVAPANGMYLGGTNVLEWSTNSIPHMLLDASGNLAVVGNSTVGGIFSVTGNTSLHALTVTSLAPIPSLSGSFYEEYIGTATSIGANLTQTFSIYAVRVGKLVTVHIIPTNQTNGTVSAPFSIPTGIPASMRPLSTTGQVGALRMKNNGAYVVNPCLHFMQANGQIDIYADTNGTPFSGPSIVGVADSGSITYNLL